MTKIVINMPDFLYKQILKKHVSKALIARIFQNGVVLPKGHGRLIDADKLLQEYRTTNIVHHYGNQIVNIVNDRATVIEADKTGGKQ